MWGYAPYWMMGYGWAGSWMMLVHGALWVLFLSFMVILVARLFRGGERPDRSSGLGVLEERYARGDIERDEFLQKKRDIQSYGA